jgi:hypothetical protein
VVLRALAAAMQMCKSGETEFGVRDLSLHAKIPYRTIASALALLRSEDDALIRRVRRGRGLLADSYRMRLPDAYRHDALWRRWRAGVIGPVHPVFWQLGPAALLTWEALSTQAATVTETARIAALSTAVTRKALALLTEHGMAQRDSGGWRRGPASLDDAAAATGAYQQDQAIRHQYADDRDKWRKRLARTAAPEPGPDPALAPRAVPQPRTGNAQLPQPRGPPDAEWQAKLRLLRRELGAQVIG